MCGHVLGTTGSCVLLNRHLRRVAVGSKRGIWRLRRAGSGAEAVARRRRPSLTDLEPRMARVLIGSTWSPAIPPKKQLNLLASQQLGRATKESMPSEPSTGPRQRSAVVASSQFSGQFIDPRCACGCGTGISLPLGSAEWKLEYDGETVSLRPSVGIGGCLVRVTLLLREAEQCGVGRGRWMK